MVNSFEAVMRWWHNGDGVGSPHSAAREPMVVEAPEPWLRVLDEAGIPRSLRYPSTTLSRMLEQTADRFGDATGLIYNHQRWDYRELRVQVNRVAAGLAQFGVRKRDRVLVTLPNCPEFVTTFFAIQRLGAVMVNVGPLMGADDVKALVELTQPRVAIGLDLQAPLLSDAGRDSSIRHRVLVSLQCYQPLLKRLGYQYRLWHEHRHADDRAREVGFEAVARDAPSLPPTISPDPQEVAVLQPTGGTTGTLKLAELSHRNLLANAMQVAVCVPFRPGQERVLALLPMFHVFGLTCGLLAGVLSGATVIAMTRFDVTETLNLIRRHRPTFFPVVPAICEAISSELENQDVHGGLEGLGVCICGAAPLPPALGERFERLTGAMLVEGYGLTEASPVTHANLRGHNRRDSIGVPMPDTRIRVVDLADDSRDVGAHEPGELWVCGPQVMRGYYRNGQETSRALFTDDESFVWLRTGDIVEYDEDGFFRVVDRRKDMINHSGLKVFPSRVEKVIRTNERVADVAVVGRPDPVHTEVVVAVVVATSETQESDRLSEVLRSLCKQHLAPYEVPTAFEFVDALPRSPLGKLLRRELRHSAAAPTTAETPAAAESPMEVA